MGQRESWPPRLRADLEQRLARLAELRGADRRSTVAHLLSVRHPIFAEVDAEVAERGARDTRLRTLAARLVRLLGGERARIERLASMVPRTFPRRALDPRRLPIAQADVLGDGTPRLRLTNGRVFLGYPAPRNYRRLYYMLRDLLPPAISADTYELAIHVQQRYCDINCEGLINPGDTVFEVGAYYGLKAIRFADACGPAGRVVAVEMMPGNEALMRRNIAANALEPRMASFHCGVWSAPGTVAANSSGRQRNSLVEIDQRAFKDRAQVPVDTLDNLIDRSGAPHVDFLNMQVNGAEIEALQGLQRRAADVRRIRIAAHYSRDGVPAAELCARLLDAKGFVVLSSGNQGSVLAERRG